MTDRTQATRRSFLQGGAVAAAPLAAMGAAALVAEHDHRAALARLQDEAAIRDLHQAWLRRINTGERAEAARLFVDPQTGPKAGLHAGIGRVNADHAAAPDEIRLAADGLSASGVYACLVETETPRAPDCTLAQMALAQGEGMIRTSQRRVLKARYVKAAAGWAIETLRFEPA
jgi:hypothetical protein